MPKYPHLALAMHIPASTLILLHLPTKTVKFTLNTQECWMTMQAMQPTKQKVPARLTLPISWSSLWPDMAQKRTSSLPITIMLQDFDITVPLPGKNVLVDECSPTLPELSLGPMQMIVMDYITVRKRLGTPFDAREQLEEMLTKLHSNGLCLWRLEEPKCLIR